MIQPQEHSMLAKHPHTAHRANKTQQGLSLIVVLLSLVTLAFASVALIRSIDTGSLVMGNLSFKKATTTASDKAADAAITWLSSKVSGPTLFNSNATAGYVAAAIPTLDITGNSGSTTRPLIDWDGDKKCNTTATCYAPVVIEATDTDPFTYRYLITRMCECAGDPNGSCAGTSNNCAFPMTTATSTSPKKGELKYGDNVRFSGTRTPYFRIIVRTEGPRNTATVTETYVHFN